ncbi:MAG TPA: haloacid dehalogenase-like hydrolase [Gemmatimonadales bacterium]|nr:haloacid dehalogenase-like hydrolase [Gemmatimonadales bacterium]
MRPLVLFDIDGTLLLTAGAGRRAITAALHAELGGSDAFERVRFDGKTDPQIVMELLDLAGHPGATDAEFVWSLCRRYVGYLAEELRHPRSETTVMPGITPLLEALEARDDVMLGLLTGNMREGAALKLQAAGIAPGRFPVGAFGSDSARRPDLPAIAAERAEPHFGRRPHGREVIIIGDTPADVTCGRGIAARAIGVATGAYPLAALTEAGADHAFEDLSDTARVLEAILGE